MAESGIGRAFEGATAGLAATVPMTAAMDLMHRALPPEQQYPLPPHQITMQVARGTGVNQEMDQPSRLNTTLVSHFGYGAMTGALYGEIEDRVHIPPIVKGAAYGLGVWAVSYLGLLPGVGILKSATKQPAGRNALMIAAHLVWGGSLAFFYEAIKRESGENRNVRSSREMVTGSDRSLAAGA